MIIRYILTTVVMLACFMPSLAWNKVGHDAITYITECNLTPRAKANIESCLGGNSIVYYASWLDMVRLQAAYAHTHKCHACTVSPEGKYVKRSSGNEDVLIALNRAVDNLKDYKNMTDSAVAVDIKILIHVVADLHCPSHVSFTDHPQGPFKFKLRNDEFLFHNYWDAAPDNSHKWYYTDYQYNLDRWSAEKREKAIEGTPLDWIEETAAASRPIYDMIHPGDSLDRAQTYDFQIFTQELTDRQITLAAYRLASILNELFDQE